jgi:peptidoglycan/LPS O-acetylase OafA/YrhL
VTLTESARGSETAALPPQRDAPHQEGLRRDIQALRALAVVSVVLFHLWPNRLTGGYVGVDVFFAISGFLITSRLLAEIDTTGRVRPGRFWARRAKRLVPASSLVLLLVALTIVAAVPRHLWRQFLDEVIASALQVENWLLAHNSVSYHAENNTASPTQHFWTLSVEEQFYVALPLLLLAAVGIARVAGRRPRGVVVAVLVAVVAGSFGYSLWITATTPTVAYFSTVARAWEFGLGALLALVGAGPRRLPRWHPVLPWLGVAAIVAACVLFDGSTAFPGVAAAVPVLGSLAVIRWGLGSSFDRLGGFGPVALLGRVSYAAYLWHWPLIVLLPFVTNRPLGTIDKVGIVVATTLVAWLSTAFVEDPIRFRPRLLGRRRPLAVAAWCGGAMAIVLTTAVAARHTQEVRDRESAIDAREIVAEMPPCLGAQALDPAQAPCDNPDLGGVLIPDPAQARADDDNRAECWGSDSNGPKVCSLGPTSGYRRHILAVGDSHNNTLIGVYRRLAESNGWRIDVTGVGGCYLSTAEPERGSDDADEGCRAWRARVTATAQAGPYDAFIVTHSTSQSPIEAGPGETVDEATTRGLVEAWRSLPDVPIVVIRDNPTMPPSVLTCVSEHGSDAGEECAVPRSEALPAFDAQAAAVRQVPRARLVDVTSFYCDPDGCPPVIGNVLVYRDTTHITASFAATLSPYLESAIVAALADSPVPPPAPTPPAPPLS